MRDLGRFTDEELVRLAQQGDVDAEEALLIRYKETVRSKGSIYYIAGGDGNDIAQEGMIGLVKAIRSYREDQGAAFSTFAQLLITRQIVSAVRKASREKHSPLNDALSLDDPVNAGETLTGQTANLTISSDVLKTYVSNTGNLTESADAVVFIISGIKYGDQRFNTTIRKTVVATVTPALTKTFTVTFGWSRTYNTTAGYHADRRTCRRTRRQWYIQILLDRKG